MTRPAGFLVLLALAGCPSKSTPTVDAGSPDAGAKVKAAPKPKAHVETTIVDKGAADAAFHVHSRFHADSDVEAFPLADGIALVQWADKREWKVSTVGAHKPPRALSGRIQRDEDRGELQLRGTTDLVFALQRSDGVLYRVTPSETKRLPNRFTHVVELRRGQWVGLEIVAPEESMNWDFAHGEYKVVGGTEAALPLVPSHLRPRRTVQLADGKICADATNGSRSDGGIWTADVDGHQYLAPSGAVDLVYRGADGECYVLDRDYVSSDVYRVKGDDTQLVAEIDFHKLGYEGNTPLQVDREGGLWFIGAGFVPKRIVVTDGVVTTTKYPLPEKLSEKGNASAAAKGATDCAHPTAMRIVAVDPNDVWILAACRDEEWHFADFRPRYLFHTGPAGTIYEWPAP